MSKRQVGYLRVMFNSRITSLWEPISAAFAKGQEEIQIRLLN
jgi:hypothetical protein